MTMGKSWDTLPFGPVIVTKDEIDDRINYLLKLLLMIETKYKYKPNDLIVIQ